MKNLLLFIFIYCSNQNISGQQYYFNRRYNLGVPENGFGILNKDSGYIFAAVSRNGIAGTKNLILGEINKSGDIVNLKYYNRPNGNLYIGGYNGLVQTSDDGYVLATTVRYTNDVNALVYRFNKNYDTLWTCEFGDTALQGGWNIKQTRDNGFIMVGQTATYDYLNDMMLVKINQSGIVQWEKHFGGIGTDIAYDIDTCFDGGFILSGSTTSFGPNIQYYFPNIFIVKTDSMGNLKWEKTFGGDWEDRMENILQSKDGNYIAARFTTKYDRHQYCCNGWQYPTIMKLDTSGNLIWVKHYGNAVQNSYLFSLIEDNENNLFASGTIRDTNVYANRGLLIKANSDGDSLWYRSYQALSLNTESYFYSATRDIDNGYIAIGYLYPLAPDTGDQDIWIVKTDSLGCEYLNCWNLNAIEDVQQNLEYKIYPNPTNGKLYFTVGEIELKKGLNAIVYDITGRIIDKFLINDKASSLDCSKYDSGIYFLTIFLENGIRKIIRFEKI